MERIYTKNRFKQIIRKLQATGLFFLFLLIYSIGNRATAQPCMPTVPTFTVDLSAKEDTTWISSMVVRQDNCCGSTNPDRCVQFLIKLNPNTVGVIFNIATGAIPSGAMYYQIGCSTPTPVGQIICLSGGGTHVLTFCKPGNNTNSYSIRAVPRPSASKDITIHEGCSGKIAAYGYDTSTIVWNSIFPSTLGKYNNYLSCTTGCAWVTVTPQPGFPPYVDYKICGAALNGCVVSPYCDTVRVYFTSKLTSNLFPPVPTYCFLDSGLIVSAGPTGGNPPYTYLWSNGSTSSKTFVSKGTYILRINDQSGCPPVYDTIDVTIDTPSVEAGPNDTICHSYTGSIGLKATGALYYKWRTDSTLSAVNIPDPRVTPKKTTTYYVEGFSTAGEYIDNGDFSKGNLGFTSSYGFTSNLYPEGYYYVGNNPNNNHPNWCACGDHTTGKGNMMIINGATTAGVSIYSKTVDIVPYTSYAFSIWIQSVHPANPAKLQFMVNGVLMGTPFTILPTVGLWQQFYTIWYAGPANIATFSIINQNTIANGNDFALDDISFGSVCPNTDSVTIYVSHISVNSKINDNNCFNGKLGSIDLTVSGGIAPYKFRWSNGDTTEDINNLKAGKYRVIIRDNTGCTYIDSFMVKQAPAPISVKDSVINIKCFGANNGSVNLSVVGGKPPYSYKWSSGQTSKDIINLIPGGYGVLVTDSNGCQARDTAIITQPSRLNIGHTFNNVSCFNGTNGSVNITVTGGVKPYSFKWSGGQVTEDISSLTAGGYGVNVTDSNGCKINDTVVISQPAKLTVSHTLNNVKCYNENNGFINLTVSGGTQPYNYLWSNGRTSKNNVSLTAGNYNVMVTDSHGCVIKDSAIISQPAELTAMHKLKNVNCFGGNDGNIDLTVQGGTKPYFYKWSNGKITEDISNLISGGYGVTVTDSHSCTVKDSVIINQPAILSVNHSINDVKCYGGNDGSVNINVSGGIKPYKFSWTNGELSKDIFGLKAGGYGVTIRDSLNCQIKDTAIITQPSRLVIKHNLIDVSCFGGNNGLITLTVQGGTDPYSYQWSNGKIIQDINNLTAGNYYVTVTDSHSCKAKDSASISEPAELLIRHIKSDVSCNNGNNGWINLIVTGGTLPYNYLWNTTDKTKNISNISAGSYSVKVNDLNGCEIHDTTLILQPDELIISHKLTNVSCNGGFDGAINLSVTGGVTPYSYHWNIGQSSKDISNLLAGDYYVTVIDSHGCTLKDSSVILQPDKLVMSHFITDVKCYNINSGAIDILVKGGVFPYSYKWNNGQTTADLFNLYAGKYDVTVTDSHNCRIFDTFFISQPSQLTVSHTGSDVSCYNGDNGFVHLRVVGGAIPYAFKWNNGESGKDINKLKAGKYLVSVTDSNNCLVKDSAVISQPDELLFSNINHKNVSCFGQNDGAIDISVKGGILPYAFLWSNNFKTEDISNLSRGKYKITVTDKNKCIISDSVIITTPTALVLTSSVKDVTCYNGKNGRVAVNISGGTRPYDFNWSDGSANKNLDSVKAGHYNLIITDSMNCKISGNYVIAQPDSITFTMEVSDASCYNKKDGYIIIHVKGGTGPYRYFWSNGDTANIIQKLGAGMYFINVLDRNICNKNDSVTIIQPPPILIVEYKIKNISCYKKNDGAINLKVSGGTPPYYYTWSNKTKSKDVNGLTAGYYSVTVRDANYCVFIDSLRIEEPQPIDVQYFSKDEKCKGDKNGYIRLTVRGGTSPYRFRWSNNDTLEDVNNLSSGAYYVNVTDVNGCSVRLDNIVISSKPLPEPKIFAESHVLYCEQDSTLMGVTEPYEKYIWNTGDTGRYLVVKKSGWYYVKVTNQDQCTDSSSSIRIDARDPYYGINLNKNYYFCPDEESEIILNPGIVKGAKYEWQPGNDTTTELRVSKQGLYSVNIMIGNCNIKYEANVFDVCEPSIFVPNVFTPNGDRNNEAFFPVTRYVDTLTFIIFNRWGEILYKGFGLDDKWDGTFNNELVMADTYCYIVYYKNRRSDWKLKSGSVNVLR